jgi:hypothetical protein
MYQGIHKLIFILIALLFVSCGKDIQITDKQIPMGNKHIIIFNGVSKITVDIFKTHYDSNYINKHYYKDSHFDCEDKGFKYLELKYLENETYSKNYIDKDGIYGCFEIYSNSQVYQGSINSVLTTDFL